MSMRCQYCGSEMKDHALFCSQCGKKAEKQEEKTCPKCGYVGKANEKYCIMCGTELSGSVMLAKRICPKCGQEAGADILFCEYCGTRIVSGTEYSDARKDSPLSGSRLKGTGRLLTELGMMSYYEGEPKVGIAKATGTVKIYDDRIEYEKKLGSSAGAAFGAVGMLIASNKMKKENGVKDTYWYRDIESVREGKYAGVAPMLVLNMKNGTVHSFAGTVNGAKIRDAIAQMTRYLG